MMAWRSDAASCLVNGGLFKAWTDVWMGMGTPGVVTIGVLLTGASTVARDERWRGGGGGGSIISASLTSTGRPQAIAAASWLS